MTMKYLLLSTLVASAPVLADEWVSVGEQIPTAPVAKPASSQPAPVPQSAPVAGNQADLLTELIMQVEQMQQEIAYLRSQVETQERQISSLQQSGQQRYLDLDRRVSLLMQQTPASVTNTTVAPPEVDGSKAPQLSAEQSYKKAMMLVRNKEFEQAQQAFADFIRLYPQDELIANAWYWSGEVALVEGQQSKALERFKVVIDQFPEHSKAADASYKYAVTLHKLGRTDEARQWLEKVIRTYSGKAEATVQLARSYLQTL
ncbi:tol-pal system protein YbgF [Bacterioplanes sanyensis]|uniref:tol-pal system protein YbgF n=1 Tax=Bacterioplanes sanyensis TaxID=1249553 RepID=UPI0016785ED3|nr:tol-pal system protein YbgF [Bacterioplanes sanyensis]GGY43737.1 tol-pal system protein YbgF [Bacterioplanes sanyensis]